MRIVPSPGRKAFKGRSLSAFALVPLLLALPGGAYSQEENLNELDLAYRAAVHDYESAFNSREILNNQFRQASQSWETAREAGDERAASEALAEIRSLAGQLRMWNDNVEDAAGLVSETRSRLLEALSEQLQGYLDQVDAAATPEDSTAYLTLVEGSSNLIATLRAEEDPEVILEPERDIAIGRRDDIPTLRTKADLLEERRVQYARLHAELEGRLEGLRRDQQLVQMSNDFVYGVERYGDTRPPVGQAAARAVPPPDPAAPPPVADSLGPEVLPLTLEERIAALILTMEELEERIDRLRVKHQVFLDAIGGDRTGLSRYADGVAP